MSSFFAIRLVIDGKPYHFHLEGTCRKIQWISKNKLWFIVYLSERTRQFAIVHLPISLLCESNPDIAFTKSILHNLSFKTQLKFSFYMLIIAPLRYRAVGIEALGLFCRYISKAKRHHIHRHIVYKLKSTPLIFAVEFPVF